MTVETRRIISHFEEEFAGFNLESPRSLQACKYLGIEPKELLRRTAGDFEPECGENPEFLAELWELGRMERLRKCIIERGTQIIRVEYPHGLPAETLMNLMSNKHRRCVGLGWGM
eukprot:1363853-Amorphochlora_amoeboformis.AAC.1